MHIWKTDYVLLSISEGLSSNDDNVLNDNMQQICGISGSINNISTKISVIKKLIRKCNSLDEINKNELTKSLAKIYEYAFDKNELLDLLKKIEKWCEYRNEIVHALLNKDLDDLHLTFKTHVEDGYSLSRKFDNFVNKLKRV